jgi:DNA polymerase-3 subunit epsilon
MRQIVFDTETTGLEKSEHRVIEIGCVEMIDRRIVSEQRWYLNPDRDSDPGAFEVHGLSTQFLADKPRFPQIADDLIALLRGAELIIHNASFDVGFIDMELERAGRPERVAAFCKVTDTWQLAKKLHPGQKASLDALCKRYGIDNSHREQHGALLDARLLADVYLAMTGGQAALGLAAQAGDAGSGGISAGLHALMAGGSTPLRVIAPSEQELASHAERIAYIVKKSGKTLWSEPEDSVASQS